MTQKQLTKTTAFWSLARHNNQTFQSTFKTLTSNTILAKDHLYALQTLHVLYMLRSIIGQCIAHVAALVSNAVQASKTLPYNSS